MTDFTPDPTGHHTGHSTEPEPNPPANPGHHTLPDGPVVTEPSSDPNPSPSDPSGTGTGTDPTTNPTAPNPIDAAIAALGNLFGQQAKPVDPEVRSADALYMQLWGVAPPKGYIEGLVKQGLNLYEIAANEMAKPAFASTKSYQDSWSSYAQQVAQVFGRR